MNALYNDIEGYAVKLLNLRIADGWLPPGRVTNADIRRLCKIDLSKYSQLHLFAGIGGFPLACRLAGLPDDFRIFTAGFPCQPFSVAGRRAGTDDNRYLWPQTLAALKSHRPDVAILENVAGLASMAFPSEASLMDVQTLTAGLRDYLYRTEALAVIDEITEQVEAAGYSVQPFVIPACGVDAKHERQRLWIVCIRNDMADANGTRQSQSEGFEQEQRGRTVNGRQESAVFPDAKSGRRRRPGHGDCPQGNDGREKSQSLGGGSFGGKANVSDADCCDGQRNQPKFTDKKKRAVTNKRQIRPQDCVDGRLQWRPEPAICRVVNGLPGRVDRIKGLGNAIVPQVAAEIIRLIMQALGITPGTPADHHRHERKQNGRY